jgi:mRNA interferase MazF
MTPGQGDIVLVPVPFTDLSSTRRRPVIVISNTAYQLATVDFVCVAVTSNLQGDAYSFDITTADLDDGTLKMTSRVRVDKVYTLAQSIIVARFGRVNAATMNRIRDMLRDLTR